MSDLTTLDKKVYYLSIGDYVTTGIDNDFEWNEQIVTYLKDKNKFEVESLVATDRYNFYATNKEEGFYIVTSEIVDIFKDLDEFYKAGVVGVFKEDYLVIGINNFHLNVNKFYNDKNLSSKEMYFKIKDHLKVINEIINKLNLKGLK